MKTLEQIQQENRKLIILANNPEAKSYEEALEMEINKMGEDPLFKDIISGRLFGNLTDPDNRYNELEQFIYIMEYSDGDYGDYRYSKMMTLNNFIKHKLLALDRVLIALKNSEDGNGFSIDVNGWLMHLGSSILRWDLTKPTLEQQPEQTQREINKLLIN